MPDLTVPFFETFIGVKMLPHEIYTESDIDGYLQSMVKKDPAVVDMNDILLFKKSNYFLIIQQISKRMSAISR